MPEGRTISCICLGPLFNGASTYAFLNLETGKVIDRYQFTERPMTPKIIARVEELASKSPHRSLAFQTRYDDEEEDEAAEEVDHAAGLG